MKQPATMLAVMVMACSQTQPAGQTTTTPSTASSATCRLPISITESPGHIQGAFVEYPGGKLTIDPAGDGGAYYARDISRWLPVGRSSVSPDKARYAYVKPRLVTAPDQLRLHVVDVATGSDQTYKIGLPVSPAGLVIVSFASEGVWLSHAGYEGPGGKLFLLDLSSGVLKDVGGSRDIFEPVADTPGAFWFTDAGPKPQYSDMGFPLPARLSRMTISNGKVEAWYGEPGYLRALGTDVAGHPIFARWNAKSEANEVWVASSPGQAKSIGLPQGLPPGGYQPFADPGRGVWIGGEQGMYLYTDTGQLQKVSTQAAAPAGICA